MKINIKQVKSVKIKVKCGKWMNEQVSVCWCTKTIELEKCEAILDIGYEVAVEYISSFLFFFA